MSEPVSADEAEAIYDVLVAQAGASEAQRPDFVHHATTRGITEYRFQGVLGFGGKVWNDSGGWRVTCYPEDRTEARDEAITATNNLLRLLLIEDRGEKNARTRTHSA